MTTNLLSNTTLGDVLSEHARSRPDRLAVVDGGVRLTYRQLDERVERLVGVLAGLGLGPGDVTLWFGQSSHRVLEVLLASARVGALVCIANWRWSVDELVFGLDDLHPSIVFWQEREVGGIAADARARSDEAVWIRHDGDADDDYEGRLAGAPTSGLRPDVVSSADVMVLYSAAFDGTPNPVALSQRALLHQALVMALAAQIDETAVYLNSGPLFHVATWMWALPTFLLGGTNVYLRRSDAHEICRIIESERCTAAFLMPPTIDEIVAANAEGRYDLTSLRAPAGPEAWNRMVQRDASPLGQRRGGYGQTEAMGLATFAALAPTADGTAGRPGPLVQLRIIDADGRDVGVGEVGEIVLRGPTVATEYRNRAALMRERRRDGWHHTRDLGRRESDGSIAFVGPMARLIKSAAENIYPAEVESAIKAHAAVADCAVIGVPDERWGQRVKALVALADATGAGEVDAAAIVEHCRSRIASYKKPTIVEFVDRLPRVNGQLDYDALDEAHGGGGYPGER